MSSFRELLYAEFLPFRELSTSELDLLDQHYQLLVRWNLRLNLTRITSLSDSVRFHYCESLFLGLNLPSGPLAVADLGSGAGFPGVPVAILRPDLQVTLIESHQRKAVFLRQASHNIANVRVMSNRAGEVKDRFDWVTSRAVAPSCVMSTALASNWALLVASSDAPSGSRMIPSPWGTNRVLAVSRGTLL